MLGSPDDSLLPVVAADVPGRNDVGPIEEDDPILADGTLRGTGYTSIDSTTSYDKWPVISNSKRSSWVSAPTVI